MPTSHSQTYNNINMCKSIGKTPLYYESSTEKHKSSSACCIKLHEVCCRWIVSVNFLVKVFHSAMKQGKIMNFLSLIGKSKTYLISPILKEDFGKCTVYGFLWVNSLIHTCKVHLLNLANTPNPCFVSFGKQRVLKSRGELNKRNQVMEW